MQYVFLCGNWDFVNVAVIITAVPRNRGICDIFTVIFPAGMGQLFCCGNWLYGNETIEKAR